MRLKHLFSVFLMLLTVNIGSAWGQASAETTLFSEDFSSYAADAVPSGSVTTATGRVVYGGGSVTYTCADNGTNLTKIYTANIAGGTSPELLVGKSGGVFTITGIPSGDAQEITVSFKQNAQKLTISLDGTGYSTTYASPKPTAAGTVSFDITVTDGADATFSLIMTAGSSNVRVDDILVTVKTAGEGAAPAEPHTVSFSTGSGNPAVNAITETSGGAGITLPAGPTPACSADGWSFAGWAAAAVGAETTTAPTLLSGTYHPTENCTLFAVYKRREAGGGSTTKSMTSFEAISGNVENDVNVSYAAAQGTAGTAPAINNGEIRIYQNGGLLTITANNGSKLNSITIGSSMTTKVTYAVDGGSASENNDIAKNGTFIVDELDATEVVFTCTGTDKNSRLYLNNLSVTYGGGGTTYYLSAPSCCEKHAITIANGIENGSVTADLNEACEGAVVTLSPEAATAYHFDAWSVVDAESNAVTVTNNQFTMPATAVTVSATFAHDACTDLATPANVVADVEITAAMLEWGAVEHADKYLVYIYDNEDNEIEHATVTEAAYIVDATLSAATTYKYSIQAQSNTPAAYCDSPLKQGTFTTEDYPAATLTLSENGNEVAFPGDHHVNDVIQLPMTSGEVCAGKVLVGWSANAECAVAPEYAKGADFTLTAVSQKLYAVYAKETAGATEYVKTALANIVSGSVVVVTGKVGDNIYAASNNNGTSAAPSVIAVTEINDKLTAGVTTNALWTLTKDGDNFSLAAGDNKMYCTATNNGVRVGTNTNNVFSIKDDYLYNNATSRYVGVYNSSDFRCYTSINSNITGQTLAFYVESSQVSYSNYSTTCVAALATPTFSVEAGEYTEAKSIELSAVEGTIYYTLDGSNPTSESSEYTAAIVLDECGTITIKAIAITNDNESAVASATYTIAIPIPANSQANPYTPAQAIEVIDGGCYHDEIVYVKGVVTRLQNAFNPTYGNYELFVKEVGTDGSVEFEFYRLYKASENTKFTEDEIGVGDTLIAVGTMKKYNNVYEFNAGCYMVEHKPYFVPKTSIANTQETAYTVAQAIAFCNDALTYDLSEEVYVKGVASGAPNNQGTFNIHDADVDNSFELYKANLNELEVAENDTVIAKGHIIKYNETTYEMAQGGLIVEVKPYVAPAVAVTGVSLDLEEASIQAGKTQQLVATVAPAEATNQNVSWSSNNEAVASVSEAGLVTAVAAGNATITVTTEDGNFTATCAITVTAAPAPGEYGTYTKVTTTADITDGEYLIVYEDGNVAFNGGLETLDAVSNTIAVEIEEGKIVSNQTTDAAAFTIDVTAGSLRAASGKYAGVTSYSNGLISSDEAIANSFSIDEDGNAIIVVTTSGGDMTMRFNSASNQNRFRYYKSGQQAIQLYKKDAAEPTPVDPTPVYTEVRTGLNNGQFYTMCLEKNVTAVDGASIWQIIGKSGNSIELGEVSGELEAGKPYFFKAEAATLKVVYGDEVATSAGTNNGLVGSFTEENITAGASNYILYDNKLYEVAAGQSAKVGANRAYVDFNAIGAVVGQSPAMRRMAMPIVRSTATGIEAIEVGAELKKVVIDGQLYIVRDGRMYDVTGQLVR